MKPNLISASAFFIQRNQIRGFEWVQRARVGSEVFVIHWKIFLSTLLTSTSLMLWRGDFNMYLVSNAGGVAIKEKATLGQRINYSVLLGTVYSLLTTGCIFLVGKFAEKQRLEERPENNHCLMRWRPKYWIVFMVAFITSTIFVLLTVDFNKYDAPLQSVFTWVKLEHRATFAERLARSILRGVPYSTLNVGFLYLVVTFAEKRESVAASG